MCHCFLKIGIKYYNIVHFLCQYHTGNNKIFSEKVYTLLKLYSFNAIYVKYALIKKDDKFVALGLFFGFLSTATIKFIFLSSF